MQLWVARGGRIFFFWYLGPILGGPGCTLALCYLHGSCWQLTTDLCWPFKRDQGGPECGAGVCAYMHVHVLEEKFFIAQFRGPPWQGWTGINKQWSVAKCLNFPPPPKLICFPRISIVMFHAGMMVCLDVWSRTSDWIWPCELQDKKKWFSLFCTLPCFFSFALTVWSNCRAQRVDMWITWSFLN